MATQSLTASGATHLRALNSVSVCENDATPAAAVVQLRDGSATGPVVLRLHVAAASDKVVSYPSPLSFPNNVYVEVESGSALVTVD